MSATKSRHQASWPQNQREDGFVLQGLLFVLLCIFVAWRVAKLPFVGTVALNGAALMQLWWPLWRQERCDAPLKALGITAHQVKDAIVEATLWAIVTTPLWLGITWYLFTGTGFFSLADALIALFDARYKELGGLFLVLHAINLVATQVLGVALVEEVFWRGYVQPNLCARFRRPGPIGLSFGTHLTTVLFAFAHIMEDGQIARLATFFPGLSFALLRNRNKTLVGCVALHAWDNLIAQALAAAAR